MNDRRMKSIENNKLMMKFSFKMSELIIYIWQIQKMWFLKAYTVCTKKIKEKTH